MVEGGGNTGIGTTKVGVGKIEGRGTVAGTMAVAIESLSGPCFKLDLRIGFSGGVLGLPFLSCRLNRDGFN